MTSATVRSTDAGAAPPPGPVGLLGGSFDPVHAGHLQLADDAQSALGLAELRWIPAGQPWQKPGITPAQHRVAMLERALAEHAGRHNWRIDRCEVERAGPSYTVDTLRQVRAALGPAAPLVWIMGFDQLRGLASWHAWESLADLAHIAYARRAGEPADLAGPVAHFVASRQAPPGALAGRPSGCVAAFPMRPVDCSATRIRAAVAAGDADSAKRYLSPGVLGYIQAHQLYLAVNGQ